MSQDVLSCSSKLIPRAVAMLNGREKLKKELERKSYTTSSALETYNHTRPDDVFHASRKGAGAIEVPQSVQMDKIRGGKSLDTPGIMQIQVGKRVVVSNM